ncbi:hypothetical protein PFICI_03564 [Pestalotiopsis fici W106-1]|uniref:tRNA wybutosine-synthesizing protein 2 n=1 Tax=Pestalotiopsis fici (strain W106-1 / CGMCC3.15140) TaxID=1229662 RepID=W3XHQ9_PESFW|nr:uncharacterized protein PFICI_03564 [Pestalotiopsis fici W106-1]ETS85539.1 hypothetical protein PFICI_03564 [Pestalotiopsis fici W106-1]
MTTAQAPPSKRPQKPKPPNAIESALKSWFASLPSELLSNHDIPELILRAPKRWVVYEPMVLLPAGSFYCSPWPDLLRSVPESQMETLWTSILDQVSKTCKSRLTHLAANEGIPLHGDDGAEENVLRSPSGLRILYGDFGPAAVLRPDGGPTAQEFKDAFWVSTKQNGIYQTWAPRWTMFSRGNVKEKARLLDFHSSVSSTQGLEHRKMDKRELKGKWAVDLYAGIGYFVFSYAKLGMRVICWELNPWSVEGLRRGAIENGWNVRVLSAPERSSISMHDMIEGGEDMIVFLDTNEAALPCLTEIKNTGTLLDIRHVNGGFLPTSEPIWKDAFEMTRGLDGAWLHLHENVGVHDIEKRKSDIQDLFKGLCPDHSTQSRVEHVELVKTFAPGVWHCVFDVYITSVNDIK